MANNPIVKRDTAPEPRIEVLTEHKGDNYPPGRMLIASPRAVQAVVQRIPNGKVLRLSDLRQQLADTYQADYTCPLTTGIFLRVAAEAAEAEGTPLPYWRVIKDDGSLLDKLPGGPAAQAHHLAAEGVKLTGRSGGKPKADVTAAVWGSQPLI